MTVGELMAILDWLRIREVRSDTEIVCRVNGEDKQLSRESVYIDEFTGKVIIHPFDVDKCEIGPFSRG